MAAHADDRPPEPTAGAGLLPTFALAVVIATAVVGFVVAVPSTVALIVALATVIAFAGGIVWVLSRLIGPGD